jgi:hypothetical protein
LEIIYRAVDGILVYEDFGLFIAKICYFGSPELSSVSQKREGKRQTHPLGDVDAIYHYASRDPGADVVDWRLKSKAFLEAGVQIFDLAEILIGDNSLVRNRELEFVLETCKNLWASQ